MDEHIEVSSCLLLDLALYLFHLLPHLFQFFLEFGGPGICCRPGGIRRLTRMGLSILVGRTSFVILILILILILIPSCLMARNFFAVLALTRTGNFPPRPEKSHEFLVLLGQLLHLSAIGSILSCQFLDVGGESLHLPLRGAQRMGTSVSCFHEGKAIRINRF